MSQGDGRDLRLTVGQATVRYLAAQSSERDGRMERLIAGVCGIFGHGNVTGIGQALDQEGVLPYYQGLLVATQRGREGIIIPTIGARPSRDGVPCRKEPVTRSLAA